MLGCSLMGQYLRLFIAVASSKQMTLNVDLDLDLSKVSSDIWYRQTLNVCAKFNENRI